MHDLGLDLQRQMLADANNPEFEECGPWPMYQNLFIAVWSEARHQPEGYLLATAKVADEGAFPDHVRPLRLHGAREYISPNVGQSFYGAAAFDPQKDGVALLEAQRLTKDEHGRHPAGVAAELTVVSEEGVTTTVLREWPDEIGRRIEPFQMVPRSAMSPTT
jgi:hypothetical protein